MSRLRRYYYDNKNQIWKNILIVVSIFIVIQILNYMTKSKYNSNKNQNTNIVVSNSNADTVINENIIVKEESLIDNTATVPQKIKDNSKIIQKFFNFCFEGQLEDAYNLLSKDCKEERYKSLSEFEELYIKNNFSSKTEKVINIENWTGNIYKISITDDIMATGKIDSKAIQDYITIVTDDGEDKINVNSFIGKEEIKKTISKDNIQITILSKKMYMDYEKYEIRVDNNTENTILLDTKESTKTMYIVDENNVKYYSQSHNVLDGQLKVNSGFSTQLEIKYSRTHSSTRKVTSLVFSNVILNYKEYLNGKEDDEIFIVDL